MGHIERYNRALRAAVPSTKPSCTAVVSHAAADGDIGGTSACNVANAACAAGGRPSRMNDIIWPAFMMAPFMLPSSRATSSAGPS